MIRGTSHQTDAMDPCDVQLINGMDCRAPAGGYVGQIKSVEFFTYIFEGPAHGSNST